MMTRTFITERPFNKNKIRWVVLRNNLARGSYTNEEFTPGSEQLFCYYSSLCKSSHT